MLRVRLTAPKGRHVSYKGLDTIHDAAILMLKAAGIPPEKLIGPQAATWGAGPIFPEIDKRNPAIRRARHVVVSTTDPEIAQALTRIDPRDMMAVKPDTGESVSLAGWEPQIDVEPVLPGMRMLSVLTGSPIALSRREPGNTKKWHIDIRDVDAGAAISHRLSRLAGRNVHLTVRPDDFYVSSRPAHCRTVMLKAEKFASVVGLVMPLVLEGSEEDLRLAWLAGVGEKTRMGLGILVAA